MILNIHTNETDDNSAHRHLFDWLYAYRQSVNLDTNKSDWEIRFNSQDCSGNLKILLINVFRDWSNLDFNNYDLILASNNSESLAVFNDQALPLTELKNSYIVCNSLLETDHIMHKSTIWFPYCAMVQCRDWWTRSFYPQLYENLARSTTIKKNKLIAINGANRANRHYFFELLKKTTPSIDIVSNINATINKVRDAFWETEDDTEFRVFLNNHYKNNFFSNTKTKENYYSRSVPIGIDNKFGSIPPGYFIMPEYFDYACVIFPEMGWLNGELNITEKACKCFYAGSMPFPLGGSGTNKLYNTLGFSTAWNLLPAELQEFDSEKNHVMRYQGAVDAIKWLHKNAEVFADDRCRELVKTNREIFLTGRPMHQSIMAFNSIIENSLAQLT